MRAAIKLWLCYLDPIGQQAVVRQGRVDTRVRGPAPKAAHYPLFGIQSQFCGFSSVAIRP
jgi:hypothetical protein